MVSSVSVIVKIDLGSSEYRLTGNILEMFYLLVLMNVHSLHLELFKLLKNRLIEQT